MNPLHSLSITELRTLGTNLRSGRLSPGISTLVLGQIAGSNTAALAGLLRSYQEKGYPLEAIAELVEAVANERERSVEPGHILELVLTGPEVPGIPTCDTAATMRTLIHEAKEEVLLVGYAIHRAKDLFEPLVEKLRGNSRFKVILCVDISRKYGDTSLGSDICNRFAKDFIGKHWPWHPRPSVFYDPRSLSDLPEQHSSLHAKCMVIDRMVALVTSANFTDAAQYRNIEAGLLVRHAPTAERLSLYFNKLIENGYMISCNLD